ncbi:MAG: HD-GYP domain-containing protein [Natronospirillum sp.]|uniref:HD-GYP domain-containing protein n=1 Tax=Natronospirillum sp. TaxID=2812955 RepID=UPI0025D6CBC3|nr:HD-GYP domain-containing protein [Natronospirillum sp.]MCH8550625.1 HD-GYP domain-containing protein [Natronospirillum sp.]
MIKVIPVSALRIGMYIAEENAYWIPSKNRSRAGMLSQQSTIERIRQLGVAEVYIDTGKGLDAPEARRLTDDQLDRIKRDREARRMRTENRHAGKTSAPGAPATAEVASSGSASTKAKAPKVPLEVERQRASAIHERGLELVDTVMSRVKMGQSFDVKEVDGVADSILGSLFRNENGFACLTRIREKDTYLLEHSLNVGVLMGLLAKSLNYENDVIRKLIAGGILHDIGKISVPDEILHKPGRLEPDEWEEMKRHVEYGYEYLKSLSGVDPIVMSICRQHHERLDGSGYPAGLAGMQLDRFGRMGAICDVYDAITADRVYHKGISPSVAMKRLVESSSKELDRAMVYQFIRCMSIYPVGTMVALKSGRAGIVVQPNRVKQASPVVRVVYHLQKERFLEVEDVDLSRPLEEDTIDRPLEPSALPAHVNMMDFF